MNLFNRKPIPVSRPRKERLAYAEVMRVGKHVLSFDYRDGEGSKWFVYAVPAPVPNNDCLELVWVSHAFHATVDFDNLLNDRIIDPVEEYKDKNSRYVHRDLEWEASKSYKAN